MRHTAVASWPWLMCLMCRIDEAIGCVQTAGVVRVQVVHCKNADCALQERIVHCETA